MKHYDLTLAAMIIIGIAAALTVYLSDDVFKEPPAVTKAISEAVIEDGLKIAEAA